MLKTLLICSSILLGSSLIAYTCQLNGRYQITTDADGDTQIVDTRTGNAWFMKLAKDAKLPRKGIIGFTATKDRWEYR